MIAIIGAMEVEIQSLLESVDQPQVQDLAACQVVTGRLLGHRVVVARTGVGKVLGALCAQAIILAFRPRALMFTGVAGGLGDQVAIGDTVIARDLVQHDLDVTGLGFRRGEVPWAGWRFLDADPRLLARARGYRPSEGRLHEGRICTGDQFMTSSALRSHRYLVEELEGLGVEMEGAAVAQAAVLHGVPFLVMRTVSDKADGQAPVDFNTFLPRAGRNAAAFVRYMLDDFPILPDESC